ncbi:unnamed protein product [Prorocentrum cordatum]|uniref:Uncharacterized protein n=1 Tax=Prorocentrum cordatum TaxID=2364126 RepID=A0ABN9V7Z1_9DINO|nr:unnamed protein product [Polarella glacialis]
MPRPVKNNRVGGLGTPLSHCSSRACGSSSAPGPPPLRSTHRGGKICRSVRHPVSSPRASCGDGANGPQRYPTEIESWAAPTKSRRRIGVPSAGGRLSPPAVVLLPGRPCRPRIRENEEEKEEDEEEEEETIQGAFGRRLPSRSSGRLAAAAGWLMLHRQAGSHEEEEEEEEK